MITKILTDEQREIVQAVRQNPRTTSAGYLLEVIEQIEAAEYRLQWFKRQIDKVDAMIDAEQYESAYKRIMKLRSFLNPGSQWDFEVQLELTGLEAHISMINFLAGYPDDEP